MNTGALLIAAFIVAVPLCGIVLALLDIGAELRIHNNRP